MDDKKCHTGFTMVEIIFVISIIGIIGAIAIPQVMRYKLRTYTLEPLIISQPAREYIEDFYQLRGRFPANNKEAGLLAAVKIKSRFIDGLEVDQGAVHVTYSGNGPSELAGRTISLRPTLFSANPAAPLLWICGEQEEQEGRQVIGENKTNLEDGTSLCK
jgi:type IV pilus assembly protein PilA